MSSLVDAAASVGPSFQLASTLFLLLAGMAVLLLRLFPSGPIRPFVILALNVVFLHFFLADSLAWFVPVGLIAWTYALGRLRASDWGDRVPGVIWLLLISAMWLFLFFVKQPDLLPTVNPFHRFPVAVIGISYMVFRCIAWVLDTVPGDQPRLLSLVNFVCFFPTLMAGPIESYERYREFEAGEDLQLNESPLPALHRMANGFLKKYLFADQVAVFCLTSEATLDDWGRPALVVGILLLPVLLYLDFSGYCDIMIGLMRLMGFRLAENFDRPWLATNIQDFWSRWHITLSEFIRNYTFNPLWRGAVTALPATWHFTVAMTLYFFTMVLMGLWHAPTWGFFAFGVLHGVALVGLQVQRRWLDRYKSTQPPSWLASHLAALAGKCATYLVAAVSMIFWTQGVSQTWEILVAICGGRYA